MGEESISMATTGTKKKKKNLFKSIKGSLKRKKKKQHPDDDSLGVSVTSNSVAGPPPTPTPAPSQVNGASKNDDIPETDASPPIQIILLLMDPTSRRFELLQLEFDSTKALVSDVLRQIEQSATEKILREMEYGGVCDRSGMEMISSLKLSVFCGSNEVVLAMPRGVGGKETAEMARPILEDEKVVEMLRPCGVELPPKRRFRGAVIGSNPLGKIEEGKPTTASKSKNARGLTTDATKAKAETKKSSIIPTAVLGIIIAALCFFAIQRHFQLSRPIQSGQCLLPGEWKSSCGIWELLPGKMFCDSATLSKLSMGKDGKLRYFSEGSNDGELKEVWSAGVAECAGNGADQCVEDLDCNGAIFTQEGEKWFVKVNGAPTLLNNDAVQKFT